MYQQGGYPPGGYPPGGYPPGGYPPGGYGQAGYPQPTYPGAAQGYYMIVSQLHGMALDVERASMHPGSRVMPWPKHGKDNQLWYDDPTTGTIRSKMNGFCLDIEGDSLRLMPFQPGDPNQQWFRDPQGYVRNRTHNRVLDIFNVCRDAGAKVGMWEPNNGPNQLWHFEFQGGYAGGSYPGYPQGHHHHHH